ncbi:MAG: beta-propeller fold lactonase family protein [Gemmatimonadales bacterium]
MAGAIACAGSSSAASVAGSAPARAPLRVYVANQASATVSILDGSTGELVETVDLQAVGFSAKAKPHDVAVEPDGSFWYVSLVGDNYVVKFDRDNQVVGRAEMETPGLLALDSGNDLLFASRSMSAVNPPARIGIINRSSMEIEEVDVFVTRPHAIEVDPRGGYVYVGSMGQLNIAVVDEETSEVTLQDLDFEGMGGSTGHGGHEMIVQWAVSPDGTRLVGTAQMSGKLLVYDSTDPLHLKRIGAVDVGTWPWHVLFTPDGSEVWLPNQRDNTVTVVDVATWTVKDRISGEGLAEPHGITISPDGSTVFVSSHNQQGAVSGSGSGADPGLVAMIDRESHSITRVTETSPDGAGMDLGGGR